MKSDCNDRYQIIKSAYHMIVFHFLILNDAVFSTLSFLIRLIIRIFPSKTIYLIKELNLLVSIEGVCWSNRSPGMSSHIVTYMQNASSMQTFQVRGKIIQQSRAYEN